ncbi:MAG: N-6 DNA methylase [Sulfurimonas sp.]
MKLSDHVDHIRELTYRAFDKQFARLGVGASKTMEIEKIPSELHTKRKKLDELLQSHIDEVGSYEDAREKALDELTFTLFNRIAAVKVMEAHNLFAPIITKQGEHGDRSFGHKAWLEENPDMRSTELEGIRQYIKYAFNELGADIPLYNKDYPYALLPHVIELNEIIEAFNVVVNDTQVEDNIWQSDDILGWLYESYNNAKKQAHKDSGDKTEYDKVSLQSQVYTPRWVVQFLVENSLGKLYLEMFPDSEIKDNHKIANAPKERVRDRKPLHEVKLIDPASGSGNFLLYAFDLFYEMYIDQIENYGADYDEDDISRLIIENNLHGIDLDDRAIQLAQLGLYIKAKRKKRTVGNLHFNVISSDFYLPEYEDVKYIFEDDKKLDSQQIKLIENIWGDLKFAYKFGSLIKIEEKIKVQVEALYDKQQREGADLFSSADIQEYKEFEQNFFVNLEKAVEKYAKKEGNSFLIGKTQDAITFLKLLSTKYDVATANPPYTDSSDFGKDLKEFIKANYEKPYKFHTNLYATFIKRSYELINDSGKMALVHPPTFMYIKTFEDVRRFILEKTHIDFFVEWGYLGMFNPSARVDSAMYILEKNQTTDNAVFMKLNEMYEGKRYNVFVEALNDYIAGISNKQNYTLPQEKLNIIKSYPFIYWISDEFREKFGYESLDKFFKVSQGMSVSNGERFLRFNWELTPSKIDDGKGSSIDWARFPKGGPYKKWTGNLWLCVNWKNNGEELKNYKKAVLRNQQYYFTEGLTYSSSGSKGTTFRILPPSAVISGGGPGIHKISNKYSNYYSLGYLNSKFVSYVINCLNPTVNTTQGDLNRIPLLDVGEIAIQKIESCVAQSINVTSKILSFSILENTFSLSPLQFLKGNFKESLKAYLVYENYLSALLLIYQGVIDQEILKNIDLPIQDKEILLESEGKSLASLPVEMKAKEAYLTNEIGEFPVSVIGSFIEALPEEKCKSKESVINEFNSLYQSNNDLEEFCIRHQVNPINVWYWFRESKVMPKQRINKIAMEFLIDMIREILMEDDDGIIPLVQNSSEKILIDRIQDKFNQKGFSSAQFSSFDSLLGRELSDYLNNHFFSDLSDYLNVFMYMSKTPFIWHLTSGEHQGFDAYIIIYKWSRDNLFRLKSVYIEHRERSLVNRQSDLADNNSAEAQNEKDLIYKQLAEIKEFKLKIDELLEEGYNPILDSGVGKNIAPLQKKKMLAYDVLNAGQLKKYLAADW